MVPQEYPALPADTVLLLDGICRGHGPGIVFETKWDVTGMLQLEYGDTTLLGDVMGPRTEIRPDSMTTLLYDDVTHTYEYGEDL